MLTLVLPFNDAERVFLDRLLDEAQVDTTLLTTDEDLQLRIQAQPLLAWKALNVQQYKARTAQQRTAQPPPRAAMGLTSGRLHDA